MTADAGPPQQLRKTDGRHRAGLDENSARRLAELYTLLIESVTDYAIFVLDASGRIMTWNAGAQRLKGYTESEIRGRHFSVFYPEEAKRAGKPEWELEVATREGRVEDEGWRLRKDGSQFWANVIITALRNDVGELVGFAKITRDLTVRRQAEQRERDLVAAEVQHKAALTRNAELADLNKSLQDQAVELEAQASELEEMAAELEETNDRLQRSTREAREAADAALAAQRTAEAANRAKLQFLSVMSHELRTPLNAIAGYAELLKLGIRGPVTAQQTQDIDRIIRSEQSLLAVINDILNYAKLEAGRVEIVATPVPVAELLDNLEALVLPQMTVKLLTYRNDGCPDGIRVRADRDKTQQILVNLVSNAIKFSHHSGVITVTCKEAGANVEIMVTDTGIGIPSSRIATIFDPFVQVNADLTREHQGTGLGLAISRDLARMMGGDLVVESEEGKGSTFTLVLPRDADDGNSPARRSDARGTSHDRTP